MTENKKEAVINTIDASYIYSSASDTAADVRAVEGVTATFERGSFTAVLGRNGSGKSTFAKLLNALLLPTRGVVYVDSVSTVQEEFIWRIRKTVGMIFQNPDNQIVGTTVEEDVAFGLENLGVEPQEIRRRVDGVLASIGMSEFTESQPHHLSGGQKQKVAIAGILAMKPECIVLDEATSMLDPAGRREVMEVMKRLNREENITVIHITHHMDEACFADRIIVLDEGQIVMQGTPKEIFSQVERVTACGLDVPPAAELMHELNLSGLNFPEGILTVEEVFDVLKQHFEAAGGRGN